MTTNEMTTSENKVMAIAALVAGLASIVLVVLYLTTPAGAIILYLGLALGIIGVILGAVSLGRKQPKGLALTGLIAGAVAVLLALAIIVFALLFVGFFMV